MRRLCWMTRLFLLLRSTHCLQQVPLFSNHVQSWGLPNHLKAIAGENNVAEEYSCDFKDQYTGIQRTIEWEETAGKSASVSLEQEVALLESGVLVRRGEFGELQGAREEQVRCAAQKLGMTLPQAASIRHQYMVKTIGFSSSDRLDRRLDRVERSFNKQVPILQLAYDLDQPPVSIFRALLKHRLRGKYGLRRPSNALSFELRSIIKGQPTDVLDSWEQKQLAIAKQNDVITYELPTRQAFSEDWELNVKRFLEQESVNFLSEGSLRQAGCNRTPDFLLLDDVSIQGRPVRWMEVKTNFASGIRQCNMLRRSLSRQVSKYETTFQGPGAVIFRYGFSATQPPLIPNVLFLGPGALTDDNST